MFQIRCTYSSSQPYGLSDSDLAHIKPLPLLQKQFNECTVSDNENWCMSSIANTWTDYKNNSFKPSQLTEETIFRLRYLQPGYKFFITPCGDIAKKCAAFVDDTIEFNSDDRPTKRAAGIIFHIKDQNFFHAGVPETQGSLAKKLMGEHPITSDKVLLTHASHDRWVKNMLDAGGIFLGTTTPEFGLGDETTLLLNGTTRNPHDPSKTTGGSSGGAAAAIAAGIGHVALGTDGAGSVRIPASFNGVVGLRPRASLFVRRGMATHKTGVMGLITRTVDDCAIEFDAVLEQDVFWSALQRHPQDAELYTTMNKPKVAVLPRLSYIEQHPAVTEVFNTAIETLRKKRMLDSLFSFQTVQDIGFQASDTLDPIAADQDRWPASMSFAPIAEKWDALPDEERHLRSTQARLVQDSVVKAIKLFFETNDIDFLITPTVADLPFDVNSKRDSLQQALESPDAHHLTDFSWNPYTYLFNWTDQAAISVPCGFAVSDREYPLPVGMQIIARHPESTDSLDDHVALLKFARAVERSLDVPSYFAPSFQHLRYGGLKTCSQHNTESL